MLRAHKHSRPTHASDPPTLYGQYVRVPEGVALPHVLPVQGLGAAPSAVPRGGVARDAPTSRKSIRSSGDQTLGKLLEEDLHRIPSAYCAAWCADC